SDGQGGWRKNEKAATELEKLSAEEITQVWPLLKDQQAEVRRGAAVFLLGLFDANDSEQVSAFTALLDAADRMVRARALDADRQAALAPLTKGLADKDAAVRLVAAARLRQLGSTAAPAVKELAAALADQSADVAEAAAEALIRIGSAAVEPVSGQLSSKSAS